MTEIIKFELNGKPAEILPDGEKTLLTVLRTRFGLTGTKFGCRIGFCGSCTVIVDGEPVRSCITPIEDVAGKKVITIEGLSKNGTLHPLQNAFIKHDALQCGYCTPGMILNAYGLLIKNPEPTRQEIIEHMEGNLCRCGSYGRIIEAIQTAASEMKGGVK
jgi:aerobic-type carbon monoxide dehydrogenase small subunit (CoxS/CutS family)